MKLFYLLFLLVMCATTVFADEYVSGYTRSDGTYVAPHYRSSSDNSYNNNYSTRGNINPYTGQRGTNSPTYNDRTPSYNKNTYGDDMRINTNNSNNYKSLYR